MISAKAVLIIAAATKSYSMARRIIYDRAFVTNSVW